MKNYYNEMTVNELGKYGFYLVLLIAAFLAPLNTVFLVVNEELFVVLSFLIFIDLFGNTILNGIADTADTKINQILGKFSSLLIQKFQLFADMWLILMSLIKLDKIKLVFLKKFYSFVAQIILNRKADFLYLAINIVFFNYKTRLRFALSNLRLLARYMVADFLKLQFEDFLSVKSNFKELASKTKNLESFRNFLFFNVQTLRLLRFNRRLAESL